MKPSWHFFISLWLLLAFSANPVVAGSEEIERGITRVAGFSGVLPIKPRLMTQANNLICPELFSARNFKVFLTALSNTHKNGMADAEPLVLKLESLARDFIKHAEPVIKKNAVAAMASLGNFSSSFERNEYLSALLLNENNSDVITEIISSIRIHLLDFNELNFDDHLLSTNLTLSRIKAKREHLKDSKIKNLNHDVNLDSLSYNAYQHPFWLGVARVAALAIIKDNLDLFEVTPSQRRSLETAYLNLRYSFLHPDTFSNIQKSRMQIERNLNSGKITLREARDQLDKLKRVQLPFLQNKIEDNPWGFTEMLQLRKLLDKLDIQNAQCEDILKP